MMSYSKTLIAHGRNGTELVDVFYVTKEGKSTYELHIDGRVVITNGYQKKSKSSSKK